MLTENDVVEAVAAYLQDTGWRILQMCTTKEHGIDILAERQGEKLAVEAKGGGSGTPGTRRYGSPFTYNQKRSHVAVALLTAARVISEGSYGAGIALPSDEGHSLLIKQIWPSLKMLGIRIFFVDPSRVVSEFGAELDKKQL